MAKYSDYVDESGKPKSPEPVEQEEKEVEQAIPSTEEKVEEPEPDDIPEKFKGKSAQELIQMYQEVEKFAGRKGQEAGEFKARLDELQKTVDTLILQQTKEPDEEVDFFSDPDTAVTKKIESYPKLKEMEEKLARYESMTQVQQLYAKHPDAAEVAQSPEFLEWVQKESGRRILLEAAQAGNPAAAESILSDYKSSKPKPDNRKTETKRGQTGATTASTAPSSRKIYHTHDIIELMRKDPRKYQAWLKSDGKRAYAEGRVRD